ncbi:hypothetical protein NOF04DRAFT_11097 [Fusarium oxysporum II5]|uniref:Uncharacterized protein n=2 Tax=Fusarium oxysporum species complex TaxID=171631 RepID=X0JF32_FUSO5|nr:uncharacterized protein FOIG_12377 [Fusarium odoratissimum NRRL 54006]EXL94935.1 hypothetical protein FOIG_12377 [Fusarium odoratissimum NRRL 54006]KAK2135816.1 hypothetical protein NOF04DRAFT_11097 [Fusarium oxysporum II5]TXC11273.1 hypothetical protein FocTR4_00006221 [Fusarium oxysporum f. sp. cubense]
MDSASTSLATRRPKLTAANVKAMSIKEILASIRRKVNATIKLNKMNKKKWRRARLADRMKRRIPTDELVTGGLVEKMD